jgi:hypothetical protein
MLEMHMSSNRAILLTSLAMLLIGTATPAAAGKYRWPRSTNAAPTIGGAPATSVQANTAYSFTPVARDAERNTLRFSIENKPVWATFSSSTGRLSGTPTSVQAGVYPNIGIRVSDGYLTSSLPVFNISVTSAATSTNTAPVISGTPPTTVRAGSPYSFTPKASDADGNGLAFSVANKPLWAVFSTTTGSLTGTPSSAQVGSYAGISISVSDGGATSALPAFSIMVNSPVTGGTTGSAALSWAVPSQNTDGSSLTNLAGFKVYHGTSASSLNDVVQIEGPASTSYTYPQLEAGTHYFAVSAYTSGGVESIPSALASKTIP